MESRHDRRDAWAATGQGGFADALGLPDDAKAMTLEQLDPLISYHDALGKRYEDTVTRLGAVSDQVDAAMREHGRAVLAEPGWTETAPLRGAWAEAFAEYHWCRGEVDAIAAYAKPLDGEEG
jgi:hypothetical protein